MFEAYSVGVRIALINQASSGVLLLSNQFQSAGRHAAALQNQLNGIRRMAGLAMAGAGVAGLGFAGLGIIEKMVKPAMEYQHQLALMNAAGMQQKEIAESIGQAWETSRDVITSTVTDNLKSIRELRTVFGDTKDAIRYLPQMQRLAATLEATLHGQGGIAATDVAFTAAKALEMRGVSMNPQAFLQQTDLIAKAVIATGGKVTPRDVLMAQKYSGQYGTTFSNDFMYGILPTLVQEYGGSSTGTALTSMMLALTGGRMTPAAARAFSQLHLNGKPLLDMSQYQAFKSGMPGVTALGAIQGTSGGITDPYRWVQEYLAPALKESGISDPTRQSALLGMLFSNRTAARMAAMLLLQGPRLQKDFNIIGSATAGVDPTKDPVLAEKAAEAQWRNAKVAIGMNVIPVIVPALIKLAQGLNSLAQWARSHPNMMKSLVEGFAALSAAMAIGGTLAALTFSLRGMSLAFTALNGAIAAGMGAQGLTLVISRLAGLVSLLGYVGLAGGAGYAAGTVLNDLLSNAINHFTKGKYYSLGDLLYGAGDPGQMVTPIHPRKQVTQVNTTINLDGRKVAQAVTNYVERDAGRAQRSTGGRLDLTGISMPAVLQPSPP